MSLPSPVLSYEDIQMVHSGPYYYGNAVWGAWSEDPVKAAVLRAILSCRDGRFLNHFGSDMSVALCQREVCFLHSFSLDTEEAR